MRYYIKVNRGIYYTSKNTSGINQFKFNTFYNLGENKLLTDNFFSNLMAK